MIAKLKWTQNNAQQNIGQLENTTMGETINNESTTKEPPPQNRQKPEPLRLKCILLVLNLRPRFYRC